MGKPEAVEFLFDREQKLIGLKPTGKEVPHAYLVRKQNANNSYLIGARPFCYHYRIIVEQTVRFQDIKFAEGVLILDLGNTTPVVMRKVTKSATDLQGNDKNRVDD